MRPQYSTANQLNSERPPMTFIVSGVSASGCERQGLLAEPCFKEHRVQPGQGDEPDFEPPDAAAQIQMRLHREEQGAGDRVHGEAGDRERHEALDVADGNAAKEPQQPKVEEAGAADEDGEAEKVQALTERPEPRDVEERFRQRRRLDPGSEVLHRGDPVSSSGRP